MVCSIKARILCLTMMVNLPCRKGSCPNFLRPTCSYTECRLSFQTGSCPTEYTTASYSSCFILILLTARFHRVRIFRGRFTPFLPVGLVGDVVFFALHRYRVSFPEPCPISEHSALEPGKGLELHVFCLLLLMLPALAPLPGV